MADSVGFVAAGLLVGLIAGTLGVGGGFVLVPLLAVAGLPITAAIATSLACIAPVAAAGSIRHLHQATADPVLALPVAVVAVVLAQVGARLAGSIGEQALGALFATLLVATAAWLLSGRDSRRRPRAPSRPRPWRVVRERRLRDGSRYRYALDLPQLAVVGAIAGTVSGLLGVSAGLLTVPLLARGLAVPLRISAGTGLLVSTATAVSGSVAYASVGEVHWDVLAAIAPAGVAGALVGARITLRVPPRRLRVAFALVLLLAAAKPVSIALG